MGGDYRTRYAPAAEVPALVAAGWRAGHAVTCKGRTHVFVTLAVSERARMDERIIDSGGWWGP